MNNGRTLTDEARRQLQAAEDKVAFLKKHAAEAEAFCLGCASSSVSMDARLSMRASRAAADNAEAALFELRCKLGM
jgi:hypothetical protein